MCYEALDMTLMPIMAVLEKFEAPRLNVKNSPLIKG